MRMLYIEDIALELFIGNEKNFINFFGKDFLDKFKRMWEIYLNEVLQGWNSNPEIDINIMNYCKNHLKNLGYCF